MIVVNPPWRLREDLQETLPWVAQALATGRPQPPRIEELAGGPG
jgi:23S rRNA A2030 N6-methylase RlmJ